MSKISFKGNLLQDPSTFESWIKSSKHSVVCNQRGEFHVENFLITMVRKIVALIFRDRFGWETGKHRGWAQGLIYTMDQLEQNRVELNHNHFEMYLKTAKYVKNILKKDSFSKVKKELQELKLRTDALKYRLGASYKDTYVKKTETDAQLYEKLKSTAEIWKKTQVVFKNSALSPKEIEQLKTLTQYSKFAKHINHSTEWRNRFFDWAFHGKNNVDAFVQFPHTVKKLLDVNLSDKIGKYGGQDLKIEEVEIEGKVYKDLTLPFEGKRESILNEKHTIHFSHDYELTIGEIFKIFKDRECCVGNLEYFGQEKGITNWNSNEWGPFNPAKNDYERVDVTQPGWIKNMPFSEEITEEEARQRFEDKNGNPLQFQPQDWVFTVIGKNQFRHANVTGAHTVLCIAVPLENGKRGLCYLSKFAWEFPDVNKEKIKTLRVGVDTLPGAIQCPDENFFQIKRDEEGISWRSSPETAEEILKSIAKDKKHVENKTFHFQILVYNCSDWVFKKLRPLITPEERDEISAMSMWDAEPEGLTGKLIKISPKKISQKILNLFIQIARPKGQLKRRKDGTHHEIRLTHRNGPWADGIFRPHPHIIITRKRSRKSLIVLNQ